MVCPLLCSPLNWCFRMTCRQAQRSDRLPDLHSAHCAAKQQLERWAGTWSAETSQDFQEVQHQGSGCVIDLAKPPANMIPPARDSLTSAHVGMCANQSSVLCTPDGWPDPSWFLLNWTYLNPSFSHCYDFWNTRIPDASNQLPYLPWLFIFRHRYFCKV